MVVSYYVVPLGERLSAALVRGNLLVSRLQVAQCYVPTIARGKLPAGSEFEIVLSDGAGNEVWRGPLST